MIEKIVEIGILFDFYGKLLSEKQYMAIELYYIHDLSLMEIGDELDITRQAAYDIIKRAEKNLYKYEENLGLLNKFRSNNEGINEIISIVEDLAHIARKNNLHEIEDKVLTIGKISTNILNKSREVVD